MIKIWNLWKRTAKAIGDFQFRILFSILYLLIFTPVGKTISLFSDTLSKRKSPAWTKIENNVSTMEKMAKQ